MRQCEFKSIQVYKSESPHPIEEKKVLIAAAEVPVPISRLQNCCASENHQCEKQISEIINSMSLKEKVGKENSIPAPES